MATDRTAPATGDKPARDSAPTRDPLRVPKALRRFAKAKPRPALPGEREW
jgi:hypothetical protein